MFLGAKNLKIIVLEPEDIDVLKAGRPCVDLRELAGIIVAYTPDGAWLSERTQAVMADGSADVSAVGKLLQEAQTRPERRRWDELAAAEAAQGSAFMQRKPEGLQ